MEELEQQDCTMGELISMIVVFVLCISFSLFVFMAGTWYAQSHERQAEIKITSPLPESK